MKKILLFLITILLCSVNNVSAFSDDFSDGAMMDWDLTGVSWSASSFYAKNSLSANKDVTQFSQANISITPSSYYEFKMYSDVDYTTTSCPRGEMDGWTRFVFGSNATNDYMYIQMDQSVNDCSLTKTITATGFTMTPINFNDSEWYYFTIEMVGNNIHTIVKNNLENVILDETSGNSYNYNTFDRIKMYSYDYVYNYPVFSMTVESRFDDVFAGLSDPDLPSTGTINWGSDSYNLGDMGALDADLVNPDFETYGYRTIIYNPDGSVNRAWMFPDGDSSQNTFDISMSQLGTYTVKLQYFTDLFNYYDLDIDTTTVTYRSFSLGSAYFSGNYFNIGDIVFFNSTLNNINNSLYFYEVNIIRPNGRTYNSHNITANESYQFTTNEPGEWTGYLVAYPKSSPEDGSNSISDTMITYGSNVGVSWVSFNDTYYTRNSWARINYGIAANDFYDSHKMQIINQEGTVVFDRQIITQSGYYDYYFYESGKYTVTIDRNWFALDWDLTDNEILALDVTEVTNTIAGGFTLGVTPTTVNCGQTIYLSAETPNVWNTSSFQIKNVSGTIMADISGQAGSWKTNQTGQFWVYLYDSGAIQDTGYFYVYGTCTGYDQISQDGQGGIQPKQYPKTDQATSNEGLQNNLLYFLGLPIFWGLIIYVGFIYMLAVNGAGSTVPFVTPVIIFMELAIGMLDPYSAFVVVGVIIVYVLGFIAKVFSISVGDTVSSVTHIGKK